jgi:type III pantothenate kinase
MNIIIDLGNSYIKMALFDHDQLKQVIISPKGDYSQINSMFATANCQSAIISSVIEIPSNLINKIKNHCSKVILFNGNLKTLLKNKYKSRDTLGMDRLALATGSALQFKGKNVLIIDAGSCITYDFISSKGEYYGGGISPGIDMRFKSLNIFTEKLPLIPKENISYVTGRNTNESILSGVMNGVYAEINSAVEYYKRKYKNLKVVLTGGDAIFLAKKIKSRTFAEPNFLLICLNQILLNND